MAMSQSDIDPDDELLITGNPDPVEEQEWDDGEKPAEAQPGRLEEREERQHGVQQHGDTFAVDSDEPTDTSGIPTNDDEETDGDEELPGA
jgi:hypothetical protein